MNIQMRVNSWFNYTSFKKQFNRLTTVLALIFAFSALPYKVSESSVPPKKTTTSSELTLIFAGDVMQHMPQVESAWNRLSGRYEYDSCFMFVRDIISLADLALVNLETTLAGKPYSGYPAFSSPDEIVTGLVNAGFDIVCTANNHCCDQGSRGIERTVYVLDSMGLKHMGTYISAEEYQKNNPLILTQKGFKLAFLNYTYGTNGNSVPVGNVVSLIENEKMILDLERAKEDKPDKIIVFIHWGEEYQREPNAFQKTTADFLFEHGADIIIGSHPHVIQPMEWTKADSVSKEKLVVWSLGNYVSNQRKRYTDGGAMFRLTLKKEGPKTYIQEAGYTLTWVYSPLFSDCRGYYILPAARYANDSVWLDAAARKDLRDFIDDSRSLLNSKNVNVSENLPFINLIQQPD